MPPASSDEDRKYDAKFEATMLDLKLVRAVGLYYRTELITTVLTEAYEAGKREGIEEAAAVAQQAIERVVATHQQLPDGYARTALGGAMFVRDTIIHAPSTLESREASDDK